MENQEKNSRNKILLLILTVIILIIAVVLIIAYNGTDNQQSTEVQSVKSNVQEISSGESLNISINELSTNATFYPIEVDGIQMEVIALKNSSGDIRMSFNTCQVCYGSGRGYYKQIDNVLICQNCGNQFTIDQVGVLAGGCNPYPILDDQKSITEDTLSISYDFLSQATKIFTNWKVQ